MAAACQAHHTAVSNHKENTYDTLIALFHFVTKVKRRLLKDHLEGNDLNVCSLFKDKRQEIWLFEDVKQALRKSPVVRLKDLSLNTLNYILKFHCNDLFWKTCLDDEEVTFEEFLNTHSTEIYELTKYANADNSPNSTLLSNKEFELLFDRSYSLFSFFIGNVGRISAKRGIDLRSLNQDVHDILLDVFCPLRRSVNCLTNHQRTICKIVVFEEKMNEEIWTSIEKHLGVIAEKCKRKNLELQKVHFLRNRYLDEEQCLRHRKKMFEDALNDALFVQDQGFCDHLRQELYSLTQDENVLLIKQLFCKEISVELPHGLYKNGMYKDAVLLSADRDLQCLKATYCTQVDESQFDTIKGKDRKSDSEKIETHNYLKLIQLLKEVGRNVLIDVLKTRLPKAHYGHAFLGMKQRLCPFLSKTENIKLFPDCSVYSGDLTDLDLSLLYIILRNLNTIPPHSKGWGNEPQETDRTISANLDRIRIAKNYFVSHFPECAVPYDMFKKAWEEIRRSIVELGGEQYIAVIDTLLTTAINPLLEKDLFEAVESLKKNERLKRKKAEKFEEDLHKVKEDVRNLELKVNKIIKHDETATDRLPLTATVRIDGINIPEVQDFERRVNQLDCEHIKVTSIQTGSIILGLVFSPKSYQNVGLFLQVLDVFLGQVIRHEIHDESRTVLTVSMETTDRNIRNMVPLSFKQKYGRIDIKQIDTLQEDFGNIIESDRLLKRLVDYCIITDDECSMLHKEDHKIGMLLAKILLFREDTAWLPGFLYILYEIDQHKLLHKWKEIADGERKTITEVVPEPPLDIRITKVKQTTATLQWIAPTNGTVSKYVVKHSRRGSAEANKTITTNTSLQLCELTPNTEYDVTVISQNDAGRSPLSPMIRFFTEQEETVEVKVERSLSSIRRLKETYDDYMSINRANRGYFTEAVNKAKEALVDPDKRRMYDDELQKYRGIRCRHHRATTSDIPTTSQMNRQTYTFGNNIKGIAYVILGCLLFLLVTYHIISNIRSEQKAFSLHQNGIYRFKRWAPGHIPYYVKEDRRYSRSELDIYEWEIKKQVNELRQQCRQKNKRSKFKICLI